MPYGTNGVYDVLTGEVVAFRHFTLAGAAPVELLALEQEPSSRRTVYGAIDSTPAQQRAISSIDDGIAIKGGNIAYGNVYGHR